MPRPEYITNETLLEWDSIIESNAYIHGEIKNQPIITEVMYSGFWLYGELSKLDCSESTIDRIIFTAGKVSFGRKDPWIIHEEFLKNYINNTLQFEFNLKNCN